jgi:hypothetical protein
MNPTVSAYTPMVGSYIILIIKLANIKCGFRMMLLIELLIIPKTGFEKAEWIPLQTQLNVCNTMSYVYSNFYHLL